MRSIRKDAPAHHLSQHFRRSFGHPYPALGHFNPPPPGRPICAYVNSSRINCFRCLSFSAKANSHSRPGVLVPRLRSPQDLGHPQAICMQVLRSFQSSRLALPSFRLRWIFDFYIWFEMLWSTFVLLPLNEASRVEAISVSESCSLKLKVKDCNNQNYLPKMYRVYWNFLINLLARQVTCLVPLWSVQNSFHFIPANPFYISAITVIGKCDWFPRACCLEPDVILIKNFGLHA